MTETKWTPGPWSINTGLDQRPYIVAGEKNWPPLGKVYRDSIDGDLPWEANAHLIAAAPELYEALWQLVERQQPYSIEQGVKYWEERARAALAKERARAALAKARCVTKSD